MSETQVIEKTDVNNRNRNRRRSVNLPLAEIEESHHAKRIIAKNRALQRRLQAYNNK